MNNDLISREDLKAVLQSKFDLDKDDLFVRGYNIGIEAAIEMLDNAESVDINQPAIWWNGYDTGKVIGEHERLQGEREFIEILAQNVPEDLCTYPEYKGKPYYSIHYKENGEDFVGFGTYKLEVLSRYLRDYFMRGGEVEE